MVAFPLPPPPRRRLISATATVATTALLLISLARTSHGQAPEHERVAEYHKRGHDWPPNDDEFKPPTPGWRNLMKRRIDQMEQFDDEELTARWNGFMITVHSALLCQNFTEYGWALTKAPQDVLDMLRWDLHMGLVNGDPQREGIDDEEGDMGDPLFVDIGYQRSVSILDRLKPIHEAWSGTELEGTGAYGLRIYRDGATLDMHVDKTATHIISSILHVDHDPMGKPWPLVIEGFDGTLNEVYLEPGDLLLYESSKCLHGRPKKFSGAWYSSLFIHYYPTWWNAKQVADDIMYRIPPSWDGVKPRDDELEQVLVRGTSLREPECEHDWCALKGAKQWRGPVEEGKILSGSGEIKDLQMLDRVPVQGPVPVKDEDEL